ncbi:MAG: hypothetical protein AB7I19_07125 [Planctomycetota bacterium]
MTRSTSPSTLLLACTCIAVSLPAQRSVSGIYPHLAVYNDEGECGIGALAVWADRLWLVTYAPHRPEGSSDKLYSITRDFRQTIHAESIGGTVANRLIHLESRQLFLGPYVIRANGEVRAIPYSRMYGRHTGTARHLTEPENKVVYATMEEGIYEVDVDTLEVKELWADEQRKSGRKANLPGYHGKGFYSAAGRYVYANNGDHAREAYANPAAPSGVLAEWDGESSAWHIVRRNQFTDVTGPGGIEGSDSDAPLWSIGWDHRSLILMALDGGTWHAYRLPKASHAYDGAHGWNTEWPRIRDIGEPDLLMTMHGTFWRFPRDFGPRTARGLEPRSTYLKVVGDFCRFGDHVVLGCDDTARNAFLNQHPLEDKIAGPGQSQSNLVFLKPEHLDQFGPRLGRGAIWLEDSVPADTPSDPFLIAGHASRSLVLSATTPAGSGDVRVDIEVDRSGEGTWAVAHQVELSGGSKWVDLTSIAGIWIRLRSNTALSSATAMLHLRGPDDRGEEPTDVFHGVGTIDLPSTLLLALGDNQRTLRCASQGRAYDLHSDFSLRRVEGAEAAAMLERQAAIPPSGIRSDAASLFYLDQHGTRWRLPRGSTSPNSRVFREVCTERNLLHAGGTFFEMPADNAGGFSKLRPICTHRRKILDYASYRGLLVLSGVDPKVDGEHIVRSDDGELALWVGSVDDLWQLGKPRGDGGPWFDTMVLANQPSDPYLAAGYDEKSLSLSHQSQRTIVVTVEADVTGTGHWVPVAQLEAAPKTRLDHRFEAALGAYWLRLISDTDAVITAQFAWR